MAATAHAAPASVISPAGTDAPAMSYAVLGSVISCAETNAPAMDNVALHSLFVEPARTQFVDYSALPADSIIADPVIQNRALARSAPHYFEGTTIPSLTRRPPARLPVVE